MILQLSDLEKEPNHGGRMWFSIGSECFPEEGWYDLPGILLQYWKKDLNAFADGRTDTCELLFMDGPYRVKIQRSEGRVTAVCLDSERVSIGPVDIDFDIFWNHIQKQG